MNTHRSTEHGQGEHPKAARAAKPTPSGRNGTEKVDIGVEASARAAIAKELSSVLADTYTLYLKTHNFHWNVKGPMFRTLHLMFEEQYRELAESVDAVAERIRALGYPAPGTYKQFAALATIKEEEELPDALEMIASLLSGHESATRACHRAFVIADEANDQATCDLLAERISAHEKTAWMLRAMLE